MLDNITDNLRQFFQQTGKTKAVFGLSGGVDSALTAKLAVMALGKENVTALILPNNKLNQDHHVKDAEDFAQTLGIEYHIIPVDPLLNPYSELPWDASNLADMNVQARARANILYHSRLG